MVYGYIRVSTDKQTVENQRFEINKFCERENLKIDGWIEETISGTKSYNKRQLGKLLNKVQKGDLIICAELSRLGRTLFMIMDILNICMTKECRVWTIKDNYRLGDDIQSKVLAFAFGLSAEIERNLISQRTKEALARKRAEGIIPGCKRGSIHKAHKCDAYVDSIQKMLNECYSLSRIAKRIGVDRNTLSKYITVYHPEKFNYDKNFSVLSSKGKFIKELYDNGFNISQSAKIIKCAPETLRKYYDITELIEKEELTDKPIHSNAATKYFVEQNELVSNKKQSRKQAWENLKKFEEEERM